jgi:hypothetical protein
LNVSNYHHPHCVMCNESPEGDRMRSNHGERYQAKLLAAAPMLIAAFDLAKAHGFDASFSCLYLPDLGELEIAWLREHGPHGVHVCCEYGCPCPCIAEQDAQLCTCGHRHDAHTIPYELNLSMRCSVDGCDCFAFHWERPRP